MGAQYASLGDNGFKGLNSRDNPNALPEKTLSRAQNVRLDRGVASSRKGTKRLLPTALGDVVYGSCIYTDANGVDFVILGCANALKRYNTSTGALNSINWPSGQTLTASQKVDLVQAGGKVYILRGYAHRPMIWDGASTITLMHSGSGAYHKFPNGSSAIYHGNRLIVCSSRDWNKSTGTATGDVNDEVDVSSYLDFEEFSLLDVFKINDGSNDYLVGVAPWVLNEFVAFMRNRIYYCSVGAGAEATGHAIDQSDCYVKILATDIGCVSRKSIVQAAGGMMFLSDNGVYALSPSSATTPEGMRLGMMGEPVSADVQDVIDRLNLDFADRAVGAYFDNRYYLAMPVNDEEALLDSVVTYQAAVITATWVSPTLTIPTTAKGGTYTITLTNGSPSLSATTANIAYNANAATIKSSIETAVNAESGWSASSATVTLVSPGVFTISVTAVNSTVTHTLTLSVSSALTGDNTLVFTAQPGSEKQFYDYLATLTTGNSVRIGFLTPGASPVYLVTNYPIHSKTTTSFSLDIGTAVFSGALAQRVKIQQLITRNNKMLVFNLTNKAWESLDTYVPGFDIFAIHVTKFGNKRRLHIIDQEQGIFVAEENEFWDEYTEATTGNNIFTTDRLYATPPQQLQPDDMVFDFALLETALTRYNIDSFFVTRGYNGDTPSDKRYSSVEIELFAPTSAIVQTSVETDNPDTETIVDNFAAPIADEHSRNRPIRKTGTSARVKVRFFNGRSQIRSLSLSAFDPGRNTISRD